MNRRSGQLNAAVATGAVAIAAAPAVPVSAHGAATRDLSIRIASVDLTDGVAVTPTAAASVDLGGATSNLPISDLLAADVAVNPCDDANVVVLTRHASNCSTSGGNQSGGVTEAFFDALAGAQGWQPGANGLAKGISGGDPAGGRNGGPGGGAFGSLPMTGLSAGSLLLAAAGLVATGVVALRTRRMGAMR